MDLLQLLRAITGMAEGYVFPSLCRRSVQMADVILNHLFSGSTSASTTSRRTACARLNHFSKRLDFGVPDFYPRGTRATAATLLREHGFSRDVVELLLAHAERNKITAAYHHHELAEERRRALQCLADQIDRLSAARTVVASTDVAVANDTAVATA